MRTSRLIAIAALAAAMVSTTAAASANTTPYAISDISPAPAAAFKISDIGAAPAPGYDAAANSGSAPAVPEDLFKISDISPR